MGERALRIELTGDPADHLVVCIFDGEICVGQVVYGAKEVENLIRELAQARAGMEPVVDYFDSANAVATEQRIPLFAVSGASTFPGKILAIRHEGIGWLSFAFRDQQAGVLGNALLNRDTPR